VNGARPEEAVLPLRHGCRAGALRRPGLPGRALAAGDLRSPSAASRSSAAGPLRPTSMPAGSPGPWRRTSTRNGGGGRCSREWNWSSRARVCRRRSVTRRRPRARAASRSGARSSSATGCCPPGSRLIGVTGNEREDDDDRIARRDPPLRGAGPSKLPATSAGRSPTRRSTAPGGSWIVCELLELPARGRPTRSRVTSPVPPQPRARPPRPARQLRRGTATRKLRIFERGTREGRSTRLSGLDGIEFSADDPLPAEPLIPGRHNRGERCRCDGTPRRGCRRARRRHRAGAQHVPRRPAPASRLVRELARPFAGSNDSKATKHRRRLAAGGRGVLTRRSASFSVARSRARAFNPFVRDLPATVRSIYLVGAGERRARRGP